MTSKKKPLKFVAKMNASEMLKNISLNNYAEKLVNKTIDAASPYVAISTAQKKIIVKKTSLRWLLRKDYNKISSDRLERVKAPLKCSAHVPKKYKAKIQHPLYRKYPLKKGNIH